MKLRSRKVLKDVLHVSNIRNNFVSYSLLVNYGFSLEIKCGKVVLTKYGKFIGDGHLVNALFDLNVTAMHREKEISNNPSSYLVKCCDI